VVIIWRIILIVLEVEIVEDYEYLLSKTFYKVKNLVKKYPELSKEFYFMNNSLLENKLQIVQNQTNTITSTLQNIINNPNKTNNSKKKVC